MKNIFAAFGSLVGWSGVALCLIAGIFKLVGSYYVFSYEAMTLFTAGIAMIAAGCLAKLEARGL